MNYEFRVMSYDAFIVTLCYLYNYYSEVSFLPETRTQITLRLTIRCGISYRRDNMN